MGMSVCKCALFGQHTYQVIQTLRDTRAHGVRLRGMRYFHRARRWQRCQRSKALPWQLQQTLSTGLCGWAKCIEDVEGTWQQRKTWVTVWKRVKLAISEEFCVSCWNTWVWAWPASSGTLWQARRGGRSLELGAPHASFETAVFCREQYYVLSHISLS